MSRVCFAILSLFVISQGTFAQEPRPLPPGQTRAPVYDVAVAKTMDGLTVYCESGDRSLQPGQKAVLINKIYHWQEEKSIGFDLNIRLVSCSSSGWVPDTDPREEEYVAPNGQHVRIRYDQYEAFLLDSNGQVIWQRRLDLERKGRGAEEFEVKKTKKSYEDYVVYIRSIKHLYVDGEYQYSDYVPFGTFNVRVSR